MKLWQKKYKLNKQIENFTIDDDFILDQRLVKYDCIASIAHAKMLGKIGILKKDEVIKIVMELDNIINLDKKSKFIILKEQEDCHTAIENYLIKKLGNLGKKIHTARSRNDQVLTALRLYYKEELKECQSLIIELKQSIKEFIEKWGKIKFPGYTHTRKAMPSSVAMWGEAFIDSMEDNLRIISMAEWLVDQSPLGTAAGYGVPIKIDRNYSADLLGFRKVQDNPIYTQISRGKFESSILHALSQVLFDLNKISTDLIIFSMPEFGYFELPKEFCTGSSIMPQKKNPDVLELMRAKYHVIISYEFQVKSMISNLISGYNRDLQLTKSPTIKGLETTKQCLIIMSIIFRKLKVNAASCKKAMSEELYATEAVYKLVSGGMPFRDAYKKISKDY